MKKEISPTKRLAGQPKKYGEFTRILSIRVPESKYKHYLNVFKAFILVKENTECNNDIT